MAGTSAVGRRPSLATIKSVLRNRLPAPLDRSLTRVVHRVRNRATDTSRVSTSISTSTFFELVFGHSPADADVLRLDALLPDGVVDAASDAHRVLASFDAQVYPTAFQVRATADSLRRIELDGFILWIDDADPSVSAIISHQSGWEWHVTEVLTSALHPGSTFVDVGANVGYHTFHAASIVGTQGSVVALEPSSENCRLLRLSQLDNNANNVAIIPLALDRETGVRYLSAHVGTNAGLIPDARADLLAGRGSPVYAATLDEIAPPRIDVLKVDVEGAEFRVLDGGRKTLQRDKPLIVMEFSCEMVRRVSDVDPGEALQDLLDIGYRLFILDRVSRKPVAVASAHALLADWDDPFRIEDLLLRPV